MFETPQGPLSRLAARHTPDRTTNPAGSIQYDAAAFLQANDDDLAGLGIHITGQSTHKRYGDVEDLSGCPYSRDHEDGAFRFQMPSGYVGVRCHHDRCRGKSLKKQPDLFPRSHNVKVAAESSRSGNLAVGGLTITASGASSSSLEQTEAAWEPPLPLDPTFGPLFPVEALPETIRAYVQAVADETQTPPALAALGTLSAAAGGKYVSYVASSNWSEPVHIMVIPVADPGNRKSGEFQHTTSPLQEWEREKQEQEASTIAEWESRFRVLEKQLAAAESEQGKPSKDGKVLISDARRMDAVRELQEHLAKRPIQTEITTDDATPEAVKATIIAQGGALAVMSAESAYLSNVAGRYSNAPHLDTILNGHAGDAIKVSRKGKQTERTERACLTLCLMVQAQVIEDLGAIDGFRTRAAAARLLPAFPADFIGHRLIKTPPVPQALADEWRITIRSILDTPRSDNPRVLYLDSDALATLDQYRAAIEPIIKSEGSHMQGWLAKLAGTVLRIASLLHISCTDFPENAPIEASTIRNAIAIGTYFHHHARIMFRLMYGRNGQSEAASMLEVLRMTEGDSLTARDLWQRVKNRSGFDREDMKAALRILEEHGWIRQERYSPPKGRPSEIIHLHPDIQSQKSPSKDDHRDTVTLGTFETLSSETKVPEDIKPLVQVDDSDGREGLNIQPGEVVF